MRLDFVFVLVAFGTVIACANCASQALTNSDIRRESDDDRKSLQEDLLGMMAATSQDGENTMHSVGQSAGRIMNAVFGHVQKGLSSKLGNLFKSKLKLGGLKSGVRKLGQGVRRGGRRFGQRVGGEGRRFRQIVKGGRREFGRALKGARNFITDHRKGISKGLGRFTGEVLGTLLDRNTGGYNPGVAPVDYPDLLPRYRYLYPYPYGAPRHPNEAPGYHPNTSPGHPNKAPGYSDTTPRHSNKAPGTDETPGDHSKSTAPRNPDTALGTPKDSPSWPDDGKTNPPSKPREEMVLAKLVEEQAAPLQQNSFIRKQNKFRYSRRGTVYKIKRFFKDIYQGLYALYLLN